jgi:hypothetical protein
MKLNTKNEIKYINKTKVLLTYLISFVLFLNFFDFIEKYIKYKKGKNVKIRFIFKFKEIL